MQLQQTVVCVSALLSTWISLLGLQGWRIMGNSWRTRQLLQVPAGGSALAVILLCSQVHTHYPDQSFTLKWRQEPCQSIFSAIGALCLDMTRTGQRTQGSPSCGVSLRHVVMNQDFNPYCLQGVLQIISRFPTGKTAGVHAEPALHRLQAKAEQWPRGTKCSSGWGGKQWTETVLLLLGMSQGLWQGRTLEGL